MHTAPIDYAEFRSLRGADVVAYIGDEWDQRPLSAGFLDLCLAEIDQLDEYHLVYAIAFGARYDPQRFAPLIPRFLADPRTSVWCAAHNALRDMPLISAEVYEIIEQYAKRCPAANLSDFLEQMRDKVC